MYNWDFPYGCKHVGCNRRFKTMPGVVRHSKKTHPKVIQRRPAGTKPIYAIAAFRSIRN